MADISVTAGSVLKGANAKTFWAIAGATITAGLWLYEDTTTHTIKTADCGAIGTAKVCGVALTGASAGQKVLIDYDDDDFTPGGTLTLSVGVAKDVFVLSNSGLMCPAADLAALDYVTCLGVVKTVAKMILKITVTNVALTA